MALSMTQNPRKSASRDPEITLEVVDPLTAKHWLETDLYERQRPLRKFHIRMLSHAINRGDFKPGTIEFCTLPDGSRFLVDGQHRLHAVVLSDTPQTFIVATYHYETEEEVEAHYAKTDGGLRRLATEAPTFTRFMEEHNLHRRDIRGLSPALRLLLLGFQGSKGKGRPIVTSRILELLHEKKEPILRYIRYIHQAKGHVAPYLRLAGCFAVGIVTAEEQAEKSRDFWERVGSVHGYEEESGEAYLIGFFLSKGVTRQRPEEIARRVARGWNAYYNGEQIRVYRSLDPTVPIEIAGTRYKGREHLPMPL